MLYKTLCFLLFWLPSILTAQDAPKAILAKFITDKIELDGHLDESVWQEAAVADDFWQYFPLDSTLTEYPTTVKVLYNDKFLYIGFYAEAANGDYVVSTLRRDFGGTSNYCNTCSPHPTSYFPVSSLYSVCKNSSIHSKPNKSKSSSCSVDASNFKALLIRSFAMTRESKLFSILCS